MKEEQPEFCIRCKASLGESWIEPLYGKYRGKGICQKCDEELRTHKLYAFRQKLSIQRIKLKVFVQFIIYYFFTILRRIKNAKN